jgi:8-oxo-dGTP pyrophosphatase MutT (NUDIX family)
LLTIVNKGRYLFGVVMEKRVSKWGVVPFRGIDNENLEFLIVSTKNGNWGLPKGNLMKKLGSKGTALQEAYEEAGIIGSVVDQKVSTKIKGKHMAFYPMEVKNELAVWPESNWRQRKWIRSNEAKNYLNHHSLRSILEEISEKIFQSCP